MRSAPPQGPRAACTDDFVIVLRQTSHQQEMGSPMKEHIFADRVANITVTGTLVRLDLAVADELPKNQGDTPVFTVTHRVLMPLDAFMSFVQMQEGIVAQLVKDGIIRKQEPKDATPPVEN